MKKQEELYSFPQQNDGAVVETDIRMIPLSELHDFNRHPFKVENDMALFELMQSMNRCLQRVAMAVVRIEVQKM